MCLIRHITHAFAIVEYILRNRLSYFAKISEANDDLGHTITELLTVTVSELMVFGISSWWGLSFLRQGMRDMQRAALHVRQGRILATWLLIYAFVGTQMGWALRPFFGVPGEPFAVIRGDGGTFYTSVLTALGWLFRQILGW